MRIAITASADSPDSLVDGRFAAARYILIFDMADGRWETVKCSLWSRQQKHSGHIRASILKEKGIGALVSGGIDPISFKELGKRGISIYQAPEASVREAADMLAHDRLLALQVPDAIDVSRLVKKRSGVPV
ncbi:NifB/NifX family molybdenum-iron cluster-binding protein [Anaeroselena agilis]|uniref:NifB/NifX family molybdenum-iron cluster-binding protein n=1 Tax=Anaeroselena agilis TaxID=3063788 RepID=A0ABU3NT25_9FIRM|nr:NifB/NifX family molybdenum-iron cluster-binding protein [Selenomonadales bacterium 4137-cl]